MVDYFRLKIHKKAYFVISVLILHMLFYFFKYRLLFPNQTDYFKVDNSCAFYINIIMQPFTFNYYLDTSLYYLL